MILFFGVCFRLPSLVKQLDRLHAAGGNYVRCTMSSRDEGDLWPFAKAGGRFDLRKWNDAYWRRFETFLRETSRREIIVQIEVWSAYWAAHIRRQAKAAGKQVQLTKMWDPWDLSHPMHRATFDHPLKQGRFPPTDIRVPPATTLHDSILTAGRNRP